MGFVEARNALQHGPGRLTDRQLEQRRREELLGWLDAAAVQRNGNVLLISAHDVARCAQMCHDFIEWLDSTAPTY